MYFVYIIQSVAYEKYYIGTTNDIRRRLHEHNNGSSKSTAPYRPFVLKRVEAYPTIAVAYQREQFLKSKKSKKILSAIVRSSPDVLAQQAVGIPISQ